MKKKIMMFLRKIVVVSAWSLVLLLSVAGTIAYTKDAEAAKWYGLYSSALSKIPKQESTEDIVVRVAKEQGIDWLLAVRIIDCESRWNRYFKEKMNDGSYDRGLFAFNDHGKRYGWVSDEQAFDPEMATIIFAQEVKAGNLKNWLCARSLGLTK